MNTTRGKKRRRKKNPSTQSAWLGWLMHVHIVLWEALSVLLWKCRLHKQPNATHLSDMLECSLRMRTREILRKKKRETVLSLPEATCGAQKTMNVHSHHCVLLSSSIFLLCQRSRYTHPSIFLYIEHNYKYNRLHAISDKRKKIHPTNNDDSCTQASIHAWSENLMARPLYKVSHSWENFHRKWFFGKTHQLNVNQSADLHGTFFKKLQIFSSFWCILNDFNRPIGWSAANELRTIVSACFLWIILPSFMGQRHFVRHEKSYFLWTLMDRVKIAIGYGATRANCEGNG